MSFTFNTSGVNNAGGASASLTVALTGINLGDMVVMHVGADTSSTTPVFSGSDGTSSFASGTFGEATVALCYDQLLYLLSSTVSGSVTYTASYTGSVVGASVEVYVFTPSSAVTFDIDTATNGANNGTSIASGNITTTGTDELVFGAAFSQNVPTYSAQQINGTNATGNIGTNYGNTWYLHVTSTFTSNATCTSSANNWWIARAAAFKISGAPNLLGQQCL